MTEHLLEGRRLGRRKPDRARPLLQFGSLYRPGSGVPQVPRTADHLSAVRAWVLGQNNKFGTCGPTGLANSAVTAYCYLAGQQVTVTDDAVFDLYRRSGNPDFNPDAGPDADGNYPGDNGVDLAVMLQAAASGGLQVTHGDGTTETVKPVAYAALRPSEGIAAVRACTAILGGVLFGLNLEQAQQQQTETRLWDYSPSPDWGGHCTWGGSYTSQSGAGQADVTEITWQIPVGLTDAFLRHQTDEAFGVVWEPHLTDPSFLASVNKAQFAADYRALTGNTLPAF